MKLTDDGCKKIVYCIGVGILCIVVFVGVLIILSGMFPVVNNARLVN